MKKWDFETRTYKDFESPAGYIANFYIGLAWSRDKKILDKEIGCTNCGEIVKYGDTYTSRTIHNNGGLGFPVCEDCYNKEWEAEKIFKLLEESHE